MIINLILLICIISIPSYGEEINKDVLSIINSLKKNTEKPLIDQDACCPACPEDKKIKGKGQGCEIHAPINSHIQAAKKYANMLLLISGEKYAVLRDPGKKKNFIEGKRSKKRYFLLRDGKRDFEGLVDKGTETADQKFAREYKHLKHIFRSGIRFRELCEYLSDNQQKYKELLKKINGVSKKGL